MTDKIKNKGSKITSINNKKKVNNKRKKNNNNNTNNKDNKSKNKSKKLLFTILIIIIVALIVSTTLWINSYKKANTKIVENSDKVKVLYFGTFDNGTAFDTNIYAKAIENNLDVAGKNYDPLEFRIGSQQIIPGFEQAVIGMKEGDKKTVHIKPSDAYGEYKESLVSKINLTKEAPRETVLSRNLEIPKKVLLSKEPGVTTGYTFSQQGINYEVTGEKGDNFEVKMNPKIGSSLEMPTVRWPATIKKVNEQEITVRQSPIVGKTYQTSLAPVKVISLTNDSIVVKLLLEKGGLLKTAQGIGKVVNVTNDVAKIDFNNPLAGKALNFEITVVSIEKADNNLKK